jgi:hypothetical protein
MKVFYHVQCMFLLYTEQLLSDFYRLSYCFCLLIFNVNFTGSVLLIETAA